MENYNYEQEGGMMISSAELGLMDNINHLVDDITAINNCPIIDPPFFNLTNGYGADDDYAHFLPALDHFTFCPDPAMDVHTTDRFRVCEEVAVRDKKGEESGTPTATAMDALAKKKPDRSKTLISEQTRRVKMKEKLYALRSLVPNITKMDKASIVGDAVSYIQNMQLQAQKLKVEVAGLESSLSRGDYNEHEAQTSQTGQTMNATHFSPTSKKIFKMNVFEVEERGFYVRMVTNKGRGVAVSLHNAMEPFSRVTIQSSNLAALAENYVFTFTMHIMEEEMMDVSLANVQLWIASSFLNQGFEFEASQFS